MEKFVTLSVLLRQKVSIKGGQKFGWETKSTSLDFLWVSGEAPELQINYII